MKPQSSPLHTSSNKATPTPAKPHLLIVPLPLGVIFSQTITTALLQILLCGVAGSYDSSQLFRNHHAVFQIAICVSFLPAGTRSSHISFLIFTSVLATFLLPWQDSMTKAAYKKLRREIAQKLRALTAPPEVLSSIPSKHMVAHRHL